MAHHQPKTPLATAIRCVLFGMASLPFTIPMHALAQSAQTAHATPMIESNADTADNADTAVNANANVDGMMATDGDNGADGKIDNSTNLTAANSHQTANHGDHDDAAKANLGQQIIEKLGFDNGVARSQSLAKLSENYHTKPNQEARCQGVWLQPAAPTTADGKTSPRLDADGNPLAADGIFAQADYGYYDAKTYAELVGNVIVEQNGQRVVADKITLDTITGQAVASGQVQFSDSGTNNGTDSGTGNGTNHGKNTGIIGVAESLQYSTDGQTATARDVAFASTSINAHGYAGQMDKISDSQYQLQDVMFSTCPPTERKWYLDANKIDINSDTGRAVAKNATLRIKEIPVFYLPYFNFPIDSRRASGFLLPTAGFGASDGFEISTPYYLNLAPNYDATITPTIFTNKNPMITGEFRYLTGNFGSGELTASYLPNDRQYHNQDRSRIRFEHGWQPKKFDKIHAYAQYQHVSDAKYPADFDALRLESTSLNLPRRIGASFLDENVSADFRFEDFQRLDGAKIDGTRILDKDRPYARLPQLSVNYRLPKAWLGLPDSLQISGIHNSAYFKKTIDDNSEPEKSGGRMFNQISASYPILRSWGYATPKLSLSHLYASYDEDSLADQNLSKQDGKYSVFAPTFSVDAGLFFEKSGSPFALFDDKLGGYQVLTPRLHYTYTPFKNQQNIPNFETGVAQLSYEQLLSNQWLLGYDRIQDLHAITPAISYRYIDSTGQTRFEGGIAEQILLDDVRVGIDNDNHQNFIGKSSGLAWQASLQPKNGLWLDASGSFATNYHLNNIVAQLRYQPSEQTLFNLGIIERKQNRALNQSALSAYTASVIFPINNRWRLMGQAQYDHAQGYLMDSILGVNYEDCCYGLSIYARRYRDAINPHQSPNTAIMAEIRLNGITSSSRLNRLLSDRILGYDQVQNAWQKAY
ncbi:LPS-assembly protein LptD [Moraxella marmotae]|uniref:LPS-assembly protein LptD n=1 Tax=Moraxella marmotae TaxID=3344520 RepID=UPI0035F2F608